MKTELGGDRLGSGNKQEVSLKNFGRSTHDLGYTWRSSASAGTLIPFMVEVGLPGDSFDIDLNCDVKTLPTVGPLYGSYKVQLDVFQCPVRLYQGKLHMNMLNIGMNMDEIKLPQLEMKSDYDPLKGDTQQINPSSIYSYLNIMGIARPEDPLEQQEVTRWFDAVPYLSYWDVYKNYYSNKMEERGMVIHNDGEVNDWEIRIAEISSQQGTNLQTLDLFAGGSINLQTGAEITSTYELIWGGNNPQEAEGSPDPATIMLEIDGVEYPLTDLFTTIEVLGTSTSPVQTGDRFFINTSVYVGTRFNQGSPGVVLSSPMASNVVPRGGGEPQIKEFPLSNIDDMRMEILEAVRQPTAFKVTENSLAPYGLGLGRNSQTGYYYKKASQEGLGLKTYQSDLFNNWISTEWIDGPQGISEVTAVSTAGNEFTIDALNLANKVYNMLNRIAVSGGTYDDWLDAVYTHERAKGHENPIYHGSLIKELSFEEVISNADTQVNGEKQPLGTLAGRGRLTNKHKGGKMKIRVDEVSVLLGIFSITPRIDYSQGNKWNTNLKTMNDYHKPSLDAIGFQELITDQLAWKSTIYDLAGDIRTTSVGKQPAWINYMTNVNYVKGNFAVEVGEEGGAGEMFMTLNRKYETSDKGVDDLTTYVDPSKFNEIFAQTDLSSQNFWVQIRNDIKARRKMSAKIIPNL